MKLFILAQAIFLNIDFVVSQESKNYHFDVGFSGEIPFTGQQNSTYNFVHRLFVNYNYSTGESLTLMPQLSYVFAPYNSNFKLTGIRSEVGADYRLKESIISVFLFSGLEYSRENYIFSFYKSEVKNRLDNFSITFRFGANVKIRNTINLSGYIDLVPKQRSSLGLAFSYSFLKK